MPRRLCHGNADHSPKTLQKPLPPLPPGLHWEKQDDGDWKIIGERITANDGSSLQSSSSEADAAASQQQQQVSVAAPTFIEHVVMADDTLVGLCLRYKVLAHLSMRTALTLSRCVDDTLQSALFDMRA
jgi:hypothetical protein